jgi:hypothetical protein
MAAPRQAAVACGVAADGTSCPVMAGGGSSRRRASWVPRSAASSAPVPHGQRHVPGPVVMDPHGDAAERAQGDVDGALKGDAVADDDPQGRHGVGRAAGERPGEVGEDPHERRALSEQHGQVEHFLGAQAPDGDDQRELPPKQHSEICGEPAHLQELAAQGRHLRPSLPEDPLGGFQADARGARGSAARCGAVWRAYRHAVGLRPGHVRGGPPNARRRTPSANILPPAK